ncbi:hypothetical protein ACP4OV_015831 [Aristida adscensionis]
MSARRGAGEVYSSPSPARHAGERRGHLRRGCCYSRGGGGEETATCPNPSPDQSPTSNWQTLFQEAQSPPGRTQEANSDSDRRDLFNRQRAGRPKARQAASLRFQLDVRAELVRARVIRPAPAGERDDDMAGAPPPPAGEAAPPPLPFLVHDVGAGYVDPHAQYSVASRAEVDATMDVLQDHRCIETPQGWVLALDRASTSTFLWRPQDGHRVALPELATELPWRCKCLLTHKLSADEPAAAAGGGDPCVVVVFDLDGPHYWFCRVRGGTKWQQGGHARSKSSMARGGIAAVGGKIYYQGMDGLGILEFDPVYVKPTLAGIKVDMVRVPRGIRSWARYFVESCDELFLVIVYFQGNNLQKVARIALCKMDFSARAWCKVDRIGDRVFLLGGDRGGHSSFGASCSASEHGLTANRIYFFNHISSNQKIMHVFDLTNRTEELQLLFDILERPLRAPFWLLPTEDPHTTLLTKINILLYLLKMHILLYLPKIHKVVDY